MKESSYNRQLERYIYNKLYETFGYPKIENMYNGKTRTHIPTESIKGYEHVLYVAKMIYSIKHDEILKTNVLMSEDQYNKIIDIVDNIFNI